MSKLRIGIIGLGVGEQHIAGYQKHPACEVVAMCDFSGEKLAEVSQRYPGIKAIKNADEILLDPTINVVSIASYDNYHYEQIVKGIEAGKHLFVEKPFVLFKKDARHIRSLLSSKPQIKLSSNLILRRCPRFLRIRDMVQSGTLGEIFSIESDYLYGRLHKLTEGWRSEIPFYSIVYGGGVHVVDLILWLTNQRVVSVSAMGNKIASRGTRFKNNDFVTSLLQFDSGAIGKISANGGSVCHHFHSLNIYGTLGTIINEKESARYYTSRDPDVAPAHIADPYPGYEKGDLIYSFIESILSGESKEISNEDIFSAMSVCFSIEESAHLGAPVIVDYI